MRLVYPRILRPIAALLGLALLVPAALAAPARLVAPPRALERYARGSTSAATFFEPLRDGPLSFRRRVELIDGARASLVGTLYAIDHDRYGRGFLDALTRAARRGVKVAVAVDRTAQLVYDVRASHAARQLRRQQLGELERAGGTVAWYGGLRVQLRRPGAGVHYKALVADGREAIMDGRNIGHEYVDRWTDFGARLRGPIVGDIGREVLLLLGRARPYRLRLGPTRALRARYATLLDTLGLQLRAVDQATRATPGRGSRLFTLVAWDPLGDERSFWPKRNRITEALTWAVDHAQREVTLSSNFVHAGKPLRRALIAAARRGVRVRLVTTGEAASEVSKLPYLITSAHYPALIAAGCEIYETRRMEHGKLYLVDRTLGAFGSYNASKVSDGRNAEGLLFTSDPRVLGEIGRALEQTIATRSDRYLPAAPGSPRSWAQRLRSAIQVPLRLISY